MESHGVLVTVLILGLGLAAPVIWAALGELVAEQSGIINPGIEGVMLGAALIALVGYHHTDSYVLATLIAVGGGVAMGALLSFLYVTRGVNQIIAGIMFNLAVLGATTAVFVKYDYIANSRVPVASDIAIPLLEDIPVLGPVLFDQNAFVYGSYVTVFVVLYLMRHTWLGLAMRAAGEHPQAVEAAGINVWRVRHAAVIIGCVLPAIGGATLVLATVGGFAPGMTAGQGFIALGVVVLARWNPIAAFAGAMLFGSADAIQYQAQNISLIEDVPTEFLIIIPYVVTILAVVFARGSQYPRAAATPYLPGPSRLHRWVLSLIPRLVPLRYRASASALPPD
jgi:general nucleoside transport system permease protein